MKLMTSKSKNSLSLYITKSFVNEAGKNTSKIVEKLGSYETLKEKLRGEDPIVWAKNYAKELTQKEKENRAPLRLTFAPNQRIEKDKPNSFNLSYLFFQKLYHQLQLDQICRNISEKALFRYDLNEIFSRLLYARILFPASKLQTVELAQTFIEGHRFEVQTVYRALSVLAEHADEIQEKLYENSKKIFPRNDKILYYDCTNFFFEIHEEDDLRKYGHSKENRPNPIVQLGLLMDGSGLPLAFTIFPGNQNEQPSLKPLEEKIMKDFNLSQFIVCTDAGLSSFANRQFNTQGKRAFLTTLSLKKGEYPCQGMGIGQ